MYTDIYCPLCTCILVDPKTLPSCGHTLCASCTERLIDDHGSFKCAFCRTACQVPRDGFKTNITLRNLVNEEAKRQYSKRHFCIDCEHMFYITEVMHCTTCATQQNELRTANCGDVLPPPSLVTVCNACFDENHQNLWYSVDAAMLKRKKAIKIEYFLQGHRLKAMRTVYEKAKHPFLSQVEEQLRHVIYELDIRLQEYERYVYTISNEMSVLGGGESTVERAIESLEDMFEHTVYIDRLNADAYEYGKSEALFELTRDNAHRLLNEQIPQLVRTVEQLARFVHNLRVARTGHATAGVVGKLKRQKIRSDSKFPRKLGVSVQFIPENLK